MERLWSEQLADIINYYLDCLNSVDKIERHQMLTTMGERIFHSSIRQIEKYKEETFIINDKIHALVNQRIALIDKFKEIYPKYTLFQQNYNIMKQTEHETERKLKNLKAKYDSKCQSLKDRSKNASYSFFSKGKVEQIALEMEGVQGDYETEKAQLEYFLQKIQESRTAFENVSYFKLMEQWNSLCKEAKEIHDNIIAEKEKLVDCNSIESVNTLYFTHIGSFLKNFAEECLTNEDEKVAFYDFFERGKACFPANLFSATIDCSPLLSLIAICSKNPLMHWVDNINLPSNFSIVCCNKFDEIKYQNTTANKDELERTLSNHSTFLNEKIYEPFFDFLYDTTGAWFNYEKFKNYEIHIEKEKLNVGVFEAICIALQNENYDEAQIKKQLSDENIEISDELLQKVRGVVLLEKDVPKVSPADEMLPKAIEVVVAAQSASTTTLQRKLKLGYARAARLIDDLEERGIIGPCDGAKPRKVLISEQELQEMDLSIPENTDTLDDAEPDMRLIATNYADFDYPESLTKDIEIVDYKAPCTECYMQWIPNFHSTPNWVLNKDFLLYVLEIINDCPDINLPTLALTIAGKYDPSNRELIRDLKELKKLYEETPEEIVITEQRYYMRQDYESRLREERAKAQALEEQRRIMEEEQRRREEESESRRLWEMQQAIVREMEEKDAQRLAEIEARSARAEAIHLEFESKRRARKAEHETYLAQKRAEKAERDAWLRREHEESERRMAEHRKKFEEGNARIRAFDQCKRCAHNGKCGALGTIGCGAFVPR